MHVLAWDVPQHQPWQTELGFSAIMAIYTEIRGYSEEFRRITGGQKSKSYENDSIFLF